MKISNSKKELARIISENGGWRDGAEWSIQDSDKNIEFMTRRPEYMKSAGAWYAYASRIGSFKIDNLLPNFHQTILSRAEYFHLYPVPDAEGWIEWEGGGCPVDDGVSVEVRRESEIRIVRNPESINWVHYGTARDIIAYRLHKPEQVKSTAVGDDKTNLAAKEELEAMEYRESPEQRAKLAKIYAPSIEQLMQIHCDRAHALSEKKSELLVAERQESEALNALKDACKEAGFDISPIEKLQEKQEPELVITDWRDLQVGDYVLCIIPNGGAVESGSEGVVTRIMDSTFYSDFPEQRDYAYTKYHLEDGAVKFIRRP